MHLRNFFLITFFSFYFSSSYAQKAELIGIVIDGTEKQNLEYATISLLQEKDSSLISGAFSDSEGRFSINKLSTGSYYLRIQFLGFEPQLIADIDISDNQRLDLGTIHLTPSQKLLDEVKITGRKTTSFHQIDRQVYDASQFGQAQGGTASDILKNLPSVSVDALGEISVRGSSGFIIMLNGKQIQTDPSVLLNQLSANAIEDIEIITAPSAKYDPDGKAGIIHIKTRKGALDGFYFIANGLVGLPSIEPYGNTEAARRFGGDVTVNYKKGKWDLSAGLDYRRDDIAGQRIGYVNTYLDEVLTEFPSYGERSFDRENYSGRVSAIFSPNQQQSFTASFYGGKRTQFRTADILYDQQQRTFIPQNNFVSPQGYWDLFQENQEVFQGGTLVESLVFYNENLRVRKGDFLIGSFDFTQQFPDQSQLSLSVLYERTILGGPTDNRSLAWPNTADTLQSQFNDNDNPLDGVRIQVDYHRKWGEVNWESGYVYRYLKHPGDFIYLERNFELGTWEVNPQFTNTIELQRQIHALYTQFSGKKKKLSYTAGIRLEYFDRSVRTASPRHNL